MRKLWFLAVLCLSALSCMAQTTAVSGTVHGPGGSSFGNGRLLVQMPNPGVQNTCVTPSVVVPTVSTIIPVTNGSFSASLVATDCMSQFIPYRVTLQDSRQNVISTSNWWVTLPGGGSIFPASGSVWIAPAGANLNTITGTDGTNTLPVVFNLKTYPVGGFQIVTVANLPAAAGFSNFTNVKWPVPFADANYTVTCTSIDLTSPATPLIVIFAGTLPQPIYNVTASGFSIEIINLDIVSTRSAKIICRGREP